jgi:hypothetical protein
MVVSREEVNSNETMRMFVHLSEVCFLCGKTFGDDEDLVFWRGDNTEITLHARCAAELAAHLLSDATKAMVLQGLSVFNRKLEKVGFLPKLSLPAKVKTVRPQKEQSKGE